MPSVATQVYYALVVAWGASFYQFFLRDLFQTTFGFGRVIQNIDEFPYSCRRLEHPRLEGCEDLWLDNGGRTLYAGCAGTSPGRLEWNQAIKKVNATGRRPGGSELIALDVDEPGADGLFNLRAIRPLGYTGATGDSTIDILGFDAEILDGDTINFYFVNQRPPVGPFNNIVDASVLGANSTIDVFEMRRDEEAMRHLRTVYSPAVLTPNRVAVLGGGEFLVTNDHSTKTGLRSELDPFIGGGNVAFCSLSGECHIAVTGSEPDEQVAKDLRPVQPLYKEYLDTLKSYIPKPGLKFPNGLTRGFDGLIYLPSSVDGRVRVYSLTSDNTLNLIDEIHAGMPLDNISPDANGDLWVPGFPYYLQTYKALADPLNMGAPATVLRIRKTVDVENRKVDYRVEKVLEDGEGKVLSGSTTVRHDVKTGRLWIGAAVHPFLVVCDPK
ncbi:calcium-dependent phosphotriesterase [Setomelanomma holmii]|uniref:Calcium-dependent phosphotriesterase n=1 Tax=Setomelanomma holmii TaxID=210430 RepID=A0A9P4HFI0_9PLEO|nr:calcium-dependent phosphotriesterase [Setomelanomma holmii]